MLTAVATLLKYVGIVVAAVLGIHGITHEYRNEKTRKLTKQGRRAIMFLVVSGCVTILASVFEDLTKSSEAAKQKAVANRQHHALLSTQAELIPQYVRLAEYFHVWDSLLTETLEPSPMPPLDTGVTNAFLLRRFPPAFLQSLRTNVDHATSLIARARWSDSEALSALIRYANVVEQEAFGPRLFSISSEEEFGFYPASSFSTKRTTHDKTVQKPLLLRRLQR